MRSIEELVKQADSSLRRLDDEDELVYDIKLSETLMDFYVAKCEDRKALEIAEQNLLEDYKLVFLSSLRLNLFVFNLFN